MAFFSRQPAQPVVEVETPIWACENDQCTCWMRERFTLEETPTCPLCQGKMKEELRLLPEIL